MNILYMNIIRITSYMYKIDYITCINTTNEMVG